MKRWNMDSDKLTPQDIRRAIIRIERLSTVPHLMSEMLEVIDNPRSSAVDLQGIINRDPGVTANVLRVANSAFYGFSREVATVGDAAVLLGFDEVKRIVLAVSVFDIMSGYQGGKFKREDIWLHSLACAVAADQLQHQLDARLNHCYTAGLLHDLGKIVIDQYFPRHMEQICELAEKQDLDMIQAERQVLGLTHSDIGYLLGKVWKFPAVLTDAIRFHHEPLRCKGSYVLTSIIHVANHVANMFGETRLHPGPQPELDQSALHILNIDAKALMQLAESTHERLEIFEPLQAALA